MKFRRLYIPKSEEDIRRIAEEIESSYTMNSSEDSATRYLEQIVEIMFGISRDVKEIRKAVEDLMRSMERIMKCIVILNIASFVDDENRRRLLNFVVKEMGIDNIVKF